MGTTLQHGIFLPAEGERNCYTGLASNWTILDGVVGGYSSHAANLTIHVTAADKEAWNGKADTSALTAHTGNTTIHVTAADKEAWNGKQDALSQTQLDAVNSGIDSTKVQQIATNTSDISSLQSGKANDSDVVHKSGNETISGNKTFSRINGVEPSSLSLPDLNNGIDISSYITHLDKRVNQYIPPSNGWLSIRVKKASLTHTSLMMSQIGGLLSSCETAEFSISGIILPVIANKNVDIYIIANSLESAKFYPCQGNV